MRRHVQGAVALLTIIGAGTRAAAQTTEGKPATRAPATPQAAAALVAQGLATAKASHKLVLVDFSASWCGWCHKFEAFIADSVAGKIMRDHFVIVPLIALESEDKKALENAGAEALMKEMGGVGGIPFFYVLDATGKKLGDANMMPDNANVGHPDTPEEVAAFDTFLKRTAPAITDAQRRVIWVYLTRAAGRPTAF